MDDTRGTALVPKRLISESHYNDLLKRISSLEAKLTERKSTEEQRGLGLVDQNIDFMIKRLEARNAKRDPEHKIVNEATLPKLKLQSSPIAAKNEDFSAATDLPSEEISELLTRINKRFHTKARDVLYVLKSRPDLVTWDKDWLMTIKGCKGGNLKSLLPTLFQG